MDTLTAIQQDINAARAAPSQALAAWLITRVDDFAKQHPEWSDEGRLNMRTQAARTAWPGCKRDDEAIDGLLALVKAGEGLAVLVDKWRAAREAERAAREALAAACRAARDNGVSAYRLGQLTGASEPAIRKWLSAN